jgi:hypothetical protein
VTPSEHKRVSFPCLLPYHQGSQDPTQDLTYHLPLTVAGSSMVLGFGLTISYSKLHNNKNPIFKSFFDLKKELVALQLLPNARLFSADTVAMFTNIPTQHAL